MTHRASTSSSTMRPIPHKLIQRLCGELLDRHPTAAGPSPLAVLGSEGSRVSGSSKLRAVRVSSSKDGGYEVVLEESEPRGANDGPSPTSRPHLLPRGRPACSLVSGARVSVRCRRRRTHDADRSLPRGAPRRDPLPGVGPRPERGVRDLVRRRRPAGCRAQRRTRVLPDGVVAAICSAGAARHAQPQAPRRELGSSTASSAAGGGGAPSWRRVA